MKTKSTSGHFVSEFANRITENNRAAAMKKYLQSDAHLNFVMAQPLTEYCNASTKALRKGNVAPTLDLFCDAETFKTILTSKTHIAYTDCELPIQACEDDDFSLESEHLDEELTTAAFKELSKLSDSDLADELAANYDCDLSPYCVHVHKEDDQQQGAYYKAVIARFRAAAEFALAIGSDSAQLWMDAIRLLQPKAELPADEIGRLYGLGLIPANVAKAYARAEEAQGQLWVDVELRKMAKPRKRG